MDVQSAFGQVTVTWESGDTADLKYSSDPDCDWDNYNSCPDSNLLPDEESGVVLGPETQNLEHNENYFFVVEHNGDRSAVVAGSPWAPGTNGSVRAIKAHNGGLFIGGSFSHASPGAGNGVVVDDSGRIQGALQRVDGTVNAVAADGNRGWYVGGAFEQVAGEPRAGLARIRPNGSLDPDWDPGVDAEVNALAVAGGKVYVGGNFEQIGTETRPHLAALEADSGAVDAWDPGVLDEVNALVVADGTLYAGGSFGEVADQGGHHLAAFDVDDGAVLGWKARIDGFGGDRVHALAVNEGTVYVGGNFPAAGEAGDEQDRDNLAAFDANTGVLRDWDPGANNDVWALTVIDDTVYAGGTFSQAGNEPRDHLAAFDAQNGTLSEDWNPGVDDDVRVLMAVGDTIHAGGNFGEAGEDEQVRRRLAAFDAEDGSLTDWNPGASQGFTTYVSALAHTDGAFYVGGQFRTAGGVRRSNLAVFDAETGTLGDWSPSVRGPVRAFAMAFGDVHVGGSFVSAEGEDRMGLAAFDAEDGTLQDWGPELDHNAGSTPAIMDMVAIEHNIYVGGRFTEIGGSEAMNIAAINIHTGSAGLWSPIVGANGSIVSSLAVIDDTLYVGGDFISVESGETFPTEEDRTNLAAFALDDEDATVRNWNPTVDHSNAILNNTVHALEASDDTVYVGGRFNEAGDAPEDRVGLAAFEATGEGDLLDWNPQLGTIRVEALALVDGAIYAGGTFDDAGDPQQERSNAAAFDANDATVLDWNPSLDGLTWTIEPFDGSVYVGGGFTEATETPRSYLAAFGLEGDDGLRW